MTKILHVYYETHIYNEGGREQSHSGKGSLYLSFFLFLQKMNENQDWSIAWQRERARAVTESGTLRKQGGHLAQFVGYINNWILGELGDF